MGTPFSVDDKLKDNPDDVRYVFWAIQHNDYKAFRHAISAEAFAADPNIIYQGEGEQIEWKFNALVHCCYENRTKMASDLLNKYGDTLNVNYSCKNEHEWTALHWAVENGWKGSKELVDVLLKNGADYNSVYDNKGRSAFDLSQDRQYWDLNMRFILGDLTEGRQSIVMEEQSRHEEEDAVASYVANDFLKNYSDPAAVASFKKILYGICASCIAKKKPMDSTLYVLAYEMSNDDEKSSFCDLILSAVDTLLDNKQSTKLDTAWLRKYLLKCCIWQKKYYAPNTAADGDDDTNNNNANDDNADDGDELQRLRRENKRLKKIITDIRELTNYELEDGDTLVEDILNQIQQNEDESDTKKNDDTMAKHGETQTKTKTATETETKTDDVKNEEDVDGDREKIQKSAWDAYVAIFNKQPDYAKEFMYFSHRLSREQDNTTLILTMKEAQDTFRKLTDKDIDINLGMSKETEKEKEAQRIRDEIHAARPVMYEKMLDIVRAKNYDEQQDLKRNITKYINDKDGIDLIKSIKEYRRDKSAVRQDSFSLVPMEDKTELQDLSNEEIGFDGTAYYSRNIYTQQLLLLSHQLNEAYQNTMLYVFETVNPKRDRVKVLSGPIKKGSRIIEKSETKYRRETFPVPAKVLDTLRCSIVFDSPKDLHQGIEWFVKYVNEESKESKQDDDDDGIGYFKGAKGVIESVVRSKNMFTDPEVKWDINNPGYADLKYNVVFGFNGKKIVCEIQFLIKEMMATKKKIHGFYSILRYQDIFSCLHHNMNAITPEKRFGSLVRAKENPKIKEITDLMITFGFNASNTLIDENWMRYALHFAAEYKTHDLMKLLLMSKDININIGDKFNQTALNQAVWAGNIPGIKMLLNDPRIDVHQLNNDGQEPLGFQHGVSGHKNLEIMKLLIEAGCSPCIQETTKDDDIHQINKDKYRGSGGMNVLHRLMSVAKDDEFVENIKFVLDVKDTYKYTVKELKNALMTKDADSKTVVDYASENNNNQTKAILTQYLAN